MLDSSVDFECGSLWRQASVLSSSLFIEQFRCIVAAGVWEAVVATSLKVWRVGLLKKGKRLGTTTFG
jgi:hypothetical protein